VIAGTFISTAAFSQVPAPPIPPQTREEVDRAAPRQPLQKPTRLTVDDTIERSPCLLDNPSYRDIRFVVRSVVFDDLRELPPGALRPSYEEYIGTEQPVAVICEIRDRAATILRRAGYVAAVEVPEQRIADGTVRFQVLMAKLVGVRVRGNAAGAERMIAGYLERLTQEEVFNRNTAERYLLLAGDLPGYDVRLSLRSANAGRGEVIGEVAVVRTPAEIDFNVQNFGSRDLGRWGGLVRGQFYGLTGLGDRTTLTLFSTADLKEQKTLQIGHDFRIGSEGLALSGQFTHAWAAPDIGEPNTEVRARTLFATAEASYPFLRSQESTMRGAVGLDFVNQRVRFNDIPLSRDKLRVAFARADFDAIDPASLTGVGGFSAAEPRWRASANAQIRQGLGIFGGSGNCGPTFAACTGPGVVPPSRLEADFTGTVLRFEASGAYRATSAIAFALGLRGQYSGNPLPSFEEFSGGNYTVGRGYDPGSLLGDSGVGVQSEVRFGSIIPSAAGRASVQPYLFFDAARVSNRDVLTTDENNVLYSAGGGLRAIYRGATIDAALAVPLKRAGILMEEKPDPRLLISISTRLFPWSF
jgi:hemolysin activation/secretion protein